MLSHHHREELVEVNVSVPVPIGLAEHLLALLLAEDVAVASHRLLQLVLGDAPVVVVVESPARKKQPRDTFLYPQSMDVTALLLCFGKPERGPDVVQPVGLLLHGHQPHVDEVSPGEVALPRAASLVHQIEDVVLRGILSEGPQNIANFLARDRREALKGKGRGGCSKTH